MGDILDEARALVQCKECPWYKACVLPLRLTPEDLKRQLESGMPGAGFVGAQYNTMPDLLASLASAAQNMLLEGCPIFIERLRASPNLAQRLKELMQTWGMEEQDSNHGRK